MKSAAYSGRLYFIFLALGFGAFLPYACFVAQANYWRHFYSSTTLTIFVMVYSVSELVGGAIAIRLEKSCTPRTFTVWHFLLSAACLAVLVPLRVIQNDNLRLVATAVPISLAGVIVSMYYASIIGASARVDKMLAQAIAVGQGLSYIVIQAFQDVVTFFFDASGAPQAEYEKSLVRIAFVYYGTSVTILLLELLVWRWLERESPQAVGAKPKQTQVQGIQLLEREDTDGELHGDEPALPDTAAPASGSVVLRKVAPIGIAMTISNITTYICFPLFVMQIPCQACLKRTGSPYSDWWSLALLTLHMAFDFVGRMLPLWRRLSDKFTPRRVIVLAYCRLIFLVLIPLLSLPQAGRDAAGNIIQPTLHGDALTLCVEIMFTFTQSFVQTLGFMRYGAVFQTDDDRARASFYLNLFLEIGLAVGGFASVGLVPIFK